MEVVEIKTKPSAPSKKKKVAKGVVKGYKKSTDTKSAISRTNPLTANQQAMAPGPGAPKVVQAVPNAAASAALAHAMSLLNPWDSKYNSAKVPSDAPIDSAIFRTHEVLVCGSPTVDPTNVPAGQTFSGFGGFVMRPNALGRSYQFTSGSQSLGFMPTNPQGGAGLIAISEAGEQALIMNMMSNSSDETTPAPVPVEDADQCAWISPLAMVDIQTLGSKYRVTSAGLIVTYIGPEVTKSGELALGVVPYDKFIIQTIDDTGGGTPYPYNTIPWNDFVNYKGVVVVPAGKGGHLRYLPLDTRAYDWKETILSFPIAIPNGVIPDMALGSNSATLRRNLRKRSFRRGMAQAAKQAGFDATVSKDGKLSLKQQAKITKTVDATGRTVSKTVSVIGKDTEVGAPLTNVLFVPWYHGQLGGAGDVPQPEDTIAGQGQVFMQAIMTGLAATAAPFDPTALSITQILNLYQDSNWSEAEDLMVVMWNNIAPADAILNEGPSSSWAGALFQVDKYVNYEVILDLNALDIGSMPPSPGTLGSASTGLNLAKSIAPVAAVGPAPDSTSWFTKAKNWIQGAYQKAEPWIAAGTKAYQVASAIADALGVI